MRSRLALIPLLFLLTACASGGLGPNTEHALGMPERFENTFRLEPQIHSTELAVPVERVAEAVPEVYRQLGLPVERSRRGAYTFTTPNLRIEGRLYETERNSEYFSCGTSMAGERADLYELEFALVVRLVPVEGGGTRAQSFLGARARDRYAGTDPVACRGTGRLEEDALTILRRQAGG